MDHVLCLLWDGFSYPTCTRSILYSLELGLLLVGDSVIHSNWSDMEGFPNFYLGI